MRLPVKPRVRLYGEGAQSLIGVATNLLMRVHQVADAAGVPVYALWAQLDDGSVVRAAKIGAINVIDCYTSDSEENPLKKDNPTERVVAFLSRLLWVPQGITCTPRSRTIAPKGWGIPDGEPGGALPQVLINQYPHNNYPDVVFRLLNAHELFIRRTDNETVKAAMEWITAPGLYMDYEAGLAEFTDEQPIGISDPRIDPEMEAWPEEWAVYVDPLLPLEVAMRARLSQYRTLPLLTEPESSSWFVHKAQPVELMRTQDVAGMDQEEAAAMMADLSRCIVVNDVIADIMDGVNSLREGVGKQPIPNMPLRGSYSALADQIITEATRLGAVPPLHESGGYRDGYQGYAERVRRTLKDRANENIVMMSPGSVPDGMTMGEAMVEAWANSPAHYDNIINSWPTEDDPEQSYAAAPIAFGSGAAELAGESVGFTYAAQLFDRTDAWLWPKVAHHSGDYGVVGWSSENTTNRYHCSTIPTTSAVPGTYKGPQLLLMAGRVQIPRYRDRDAIILGAALCGRVEHDGNQLEAVRVAVLTADAFGGNYDLTLSVETWALQDLPRDEAQPISETAITLPAKTRVSRFNFAPDGSKGAATVYSQTEPYTGRTLSVYRTILAADADDGVAVNPGTSVQIMRYENEALSLSSPQTITVTPTIESVDRDRTAADQGKFPGGSTIRFNRYAAACEGEYLAYVDYDANGSEIEGRIYVKVETDLAGSFSVDSYTDDRQLVSGLGTGRRPEDGEYNYNFVTRYKEIKIPDSRSYPPPDDAVYLHTERMELRVGSDVVVLTDYENTEHWGVGAGFTRLVSHLDIRNLSQSLLYKSEFANGQCREVWEYGGQEVGEAVENSYIHPGNFLGVPRFIPPVVAGGVIRQGVGRVFVIPGEDHFRYHPGYPDDLINEKYLSDFRVAIVFTPKDSNNVEMGIPAEPFMAVLSPDVNEGASYQTIAGQGPSGNPYEGSWRLAPRCIVAREVAPPYYPILEPVELTRIEKMREVYGQVVSYKDEYLMALKASVITGCPLVERTNEAFWQSSIDGLADAMGVDQFDDIGNIGIA